MSTPASFLSTEPCRQGTKSGYSMPRDATFRVVPHNHWNAYNHHHSDNSDDDNKRCHIDHQDGDDRILSEQEWPFIQSPNTTKNNLGVAWIRRELKRHTVEKKESTDSDKAGPIGSKPFQRIRAGAHSLLDKTLSASPIPSNCHRPGRGTKQLPVGASPGSTDRRPQRRVRGNAQRAAKLPTHGPHSYGNRWRTH